MNNFTSVFEELSKLYEEDLQEAELQEEKVEEACTEELTEAGVEDDFVDEEGIPMDAPVEEPAVEDEPRQLICECDKCGALVIKDEADIVADEESDLVNVEDECQFCEEAKGYKIIGVVAPYEVAEETAEVEEEAAVEESVEAPAQVEEPAEEAPAE